MVSASPIVVSACAALLSTQSSLETDKEQWLVTGAVRSRPLGGIIGAEVLYPADENGKWFLGGYANFAYYWLEMGAKIEWRHRDGLLVGSMWAGVEPGEFIPKASQSREREPGLRGVGRARLELNLRQGSFWLYDRVTFEARARTFEEHDPFRDADLDTELSFEEALAPLVRLVSLGDASLWAYVEGTILLEVSEGLLDLRPSAGLILENWPDGVTTNLDLFYGLREGELEGFGALAFVWWRI